MSNNALNALADRVIEDLIDSSESEEQAQEYVSEFVDGAVPVYYSGQIELLQNTDVGHIDVSEFVSGGEVTPFKALAVAIYMGIEEIVQERWDEVVIGIAEKLGNATEE
jgi:hypothetical protein